MKSTCLTLTAGSPGPAGRSVSPATGRLVHSDEIHMALLQLWEDSFVLGRCPSCDDRVHSARSVRSGKMMLFNKTLTVVGTETLTSSTRAIAIVGRRRLDVSSPVLPKVEVNRRLAQPAKPSISLSKTTSSKFY